MVLPDRLHTWLGQVSRIVALAAFGAVIGVLSAEAGVRTGLAIAYRTAPCTPYWHCPNR